MFNIYSITEQLKTCGSLNVQGTDSYVKIKKRTGAQNPIECHTIPVYDPVENSDHLALCRRRGTVFIIAHVLHGQILKFQSG